jgi:hemerythrin
MILGLTIFGGRDVMPIIECNDKFKLCIEDIDNGNTRLIDLLNTIYDEFAQTGNVKDFDSITTALANHAAHIFSYEENLLSETSYAGLVEHQKEHGMFKDTVFKLKGARKHNTALTVEMLWFLAGWVTNHMRGTDVELGHYLLSLKALKSK